MQGLRSKVCATRYVSQRKAQAQNAHSSFLDFQAISGTRDQEI